ncbi:MAG: nucleolar RNA-binding Nop10p family protein [Candidatus Micrarchaeia archaeon]
MKFLIHKCRVCGNYTLEEVHCNERTASAHPARFSPLDRYAKYRRKVFE